MRNWTFVVGLILLYNSVNISAQGVYDGSVDEKEILTPLPGNTPRINGPKIYGARPGRIFLYRIPCQGKRPFKFKVTNLPEGLVLDSEKGIITGTVPSTKGQYEMVFSVQNKYGKASRTFKLVVGDKLALTPPTGWNTWGGHMIKVSDELIRETADIFDEKGFADVGYQYISIDDCWMRINPDVLASFGKSYRDKYEGFDYTGVEGEVRDVNGNVLPNVHFPDMKATTDYVHSKGLKAGIYSSPGRLTCQKFEASFDHQQQDADQYAMWGFDLLKYDLCTGSIGLCKIREENPGYSQSQYWKPMAEYIQTQDRDILFNLCQYGREDPWKWAPSLGIQSWRIGGDLNHHVETYFDQALRLATELREYSGPGHWNDPDFLYIHKIRDYRKMANPVVEIPLSTNQRYQYATLWSVICAPFFFSCNINEMDEFTIRLLTNADVLNINQDESGHVGKVVLNENGKVVFLKNLADNTKAVAVFNRNEKEDIITVNWEDVEACCLQKVYDVWRQKDLGIYKGGIDVKLSANGVAYFIINEN